MLWFNKKKKKIKVDMPEIEETSVPFKLLQLPLDVRASALCRLMEIDPMKVSSLAYEMGRIESALKA